MHNGNWNDHMDGGSWWWWWIPMTAMMLAFVGALVWLVVVLARGTGHTAGPAPAAPTGPPARPTAQDILAERLARGEIEPDDYRRRLEALVGSVST